ncbi:hypothetical protein FOPG_19430 [Fusarium oxysporum f. sp. conglutinans race 2 54008]|uniref:Uncharacterized protein n=2 Tax=Fusarium oxysporum TaxID=5507 RepID=X0GM09_FUSOX|nr:hypothetical protein FOPG_19430 [Fusarium oxysporum f. sp. conglutinans race 2 54008]KAG7403913.1 hypothetical protein Forpi1262_v018693 [Fusarium oxysporum f. sp. raphani]
MRIATLIKLDLQYRDERVIPQQQHSAFLQHASLAMHGADAGLNGKLEMSNLAEAELKAPIWIDLKENS